MKGYVFGWLSKINHMKIFSSQKRYCQEVILCDRRNFSYLLSIWPRENYHECKAHFTSDIRAAHTNHPLGHRFQTFLRSKGLRPLRGIMCPQETRRVRAISGARKITFGDPRPRDRVGRDKASTHVSPEGDHVAQPSRPEGPISLFFILRRVDLFGNQWFIIKIFPAFMMVLVRQIFQFKSK